MPNPHEKLRADGPAFITHPHFLILTTFLCHVEELQVEVQDNNNQIATKDGQIQELRRQLEVSDCVM